MSDVLLSQTADGGEITVANGQVALTGGLESAVYLSIFGGNDSDSGQESTAPKQWWGNLDEPDPAGRYRGQTQYLLRALPLVPAKPTVPVPAHS